MASVCLSNILTNGQYPEIPAEEFVRYSNAITSLLSQPESKLIVLLVGVSGSGKTFLRNRLLSQIPPSLNLTPRTFCLDEYREKANGGKYPVGDAQHKSINKKVIPQFERDVASSRDRLIIMDNTHLRWSPDWETPVKKAINEGYHLLPITPPLNEYMFCTNRSGHGVDEKLFFQMAAAWGGNKFSPFLYKLIAPEALKSMKPLKRDNFIKMKLFPWGRGWLYVQDQYLGYIDKEMVYATLHAGEEMRRGGVEEYFMRKDGNIHITLIDPGRFPESDLSKIAQSIVSQFKDPPKTIYTGVGTLEDTNQDLQTYFLTVNNTSQTEWENIISTASQKALGKTAELQPDGVHVTLGFRNRDIWRRSKRVDPIFPFSDPEAALQPHVYLPKFRGELATAPSVEEGGGREGSPGTDPLPMPKDVGEIFTQSMRKFLKGRPIALTNVPKPQLAIWDYLFTHRNVKAKWRECPDGYYLVGFSVHSGKRYLSDDDAYKKNPRLQALVPRGLTHGFKLDKDGTVHWLGAVYPTSKFFGDNDTEEGVDLVGEEELRAETSGGNNVRFILTEKANGEMFTFTVLDKIPTHNGDKYVIVCGSKNNKYLFQLILSGPKKTQPQELAKMLTDYLSPTEQKQFPECYKKSRKWTYTRVWLEMSDVFLVRLLDNPNAVWLCDMLYDTKQTVCAEFESWLHPHILAFEDGHQHHQIFALTTYKEDGSPQQTEDTLRFKQLLELKSKGFGTVEISETPKTDVLEIRHDVWHRKNSEGVVLLVVINGKIEKMIKMKTIWYVVHRGFRENLKRHVVSSKNAGPLQLSDIRPGLQKKLREKLAIFGLKTDGYWNDYLESLAEFIVDARKQWGQEKLAEVFQFDYPKIIAGAEEVMEKNPKRKGKDDMRVYEIAGGKRSPSPSGDRAAKKGR